MSDADAIDILRSELIPQELFWHGFPTRHGGVSRGLRASLNLGFRWGDDLALVEENRRILAAHEGWDPDDLVVTKHVHGTNVWRVGEPLEADAEFDGLVSGLPGKVLGAFAADCIPIVFADPDARICGAAHAGWRGTVAGMGARVVERMTAIGAAPARIRAALGPSIGPCCFEVGPEVVAEFRAALPDVDRLIVAGPKKEHIDLRVAMRTILERAGLLPEHIDDTPPCTRCNPDDWFSYRRDGKEGGVHMGYIGLR